MTPRCFSTLNACFLSHPYSWSVLQPRPKGQCQCFCSIHIHSQLLSARTSTRLPWGDRSYPTLAPTWSLLEKPDPLCHHSHPKHNLCSVGGWGHSGHGEPDLQPRGLTAGQGLVLIYGPSESQVPTLPAGQPGSFFATALQQPQVQVNPSGLTRMEV